MDAAELDAEGLDRRIAAQELAVHLSRCVSVDLEVDKETERIHALAGVRPDTGKRYFCSDTRRSLRRDLAVLDNLAEGADFVLGHNLINFDLPHLRAADPGLRILRMLAVDTLWLNPLAFPRQPYHHLVKHYKEGDLKRHTRNDPELDAQLALDAFKNQQEALLDTEPRLLAAWHWLCSGDGNEGFTLVFEALRGSVTPSAVEARRAIEALLEGITCRTQAHEAVEAAEDHGWSLAYALAWLSVAPRPANDESASESGFSVMPPWVRHQFPEAGRLIRRLRDTACESNHCAWCREHHDAQRELKRFFGFDEFRSQPEDAEGRSLQQTITQDAMSGRHVLGILPTGTGKSVCYQVPALSRHDKTGAVTVVISPLVALMADQVAGLEAHGITSCVTVNGMLSMPERSEALTKLRLGDAAMVLISPEQLRSQALRRALDQREIGAWVLDEAHCLSKWGHDFRPDYRYVGRFIREQAEKSGQAGSLEVPPILCLTATAKPEVKEEIIDYFWQTLGIEMRVRDGGSRRSNLAFVVVETTEANKLNDIRISLERHLGAETTGGAIVYCATRRRTEEVAQFLRDTGMEAERFHAGLKPEEKKQIQQRFKDGDLRVLAATNAFGMGIDKPDVRLVIHADIPSSLENYLQEAGRAGRDGDEAHCVLLYTKDDVERQFSMSARSRLTKHDIHMVFRALKRLSRRYRKYGDQEPLIATAGEILSADEDKAFRRDTATDDTRVRTALLWLEESRLLTRDENRVRIFPSSLRVGSVEDAERRLQKAVSDEDYRFQLTGIVRRLLEAAPDEGISTDELMSYTGLSSEGVRVALHDLERFGIAGNDVALTAFVHVGAPRPSRKRFGEAQELEMSLLEQMREKAPDMALEESAPLNLRLAAQQLSDSLDRRVLPGQVTRILRSVADDGRGEDSGGGSLALRKRDAESVNVTLKREWGSVARMAQRRRDAAGRLLEHLLDCLPRGVRGGDLLAETTLGELQKALTADARLAEQTTDARKLVERSLLWLHEQDVIRLNKGLAVFRPAMTIRLHSTQRSFTKEDFTELQLHYNSTVRQIHIMAEYAQQGLASLADAVRLSLDYFVLGEAEFLRRWLPDSELSRQTTPESWHRIVASLRNPAQRRLVADDRENANVLVLAGPGSGKTRVLVHRIAYLIRVRREDPRSILALAYNRHAAVEIRRRLTELIGDDARGVMVLTCHAMAMRLVGASFSSQAARPHQKELQEQLDRVIKDAVALLRGEGLESDDTEEAEEARDRLLAGFRWILVDEYQDVGLDEYELIDALAGRTISDENAKLNLFAVGDDDQNIYSFNGSSVAYIRRFEQDYKAKPAYLTDNYRSTRHIIDASNALIAPALERLKKDNPIHVNQARLKEPAGGEWTARDPVAQGRVQIMSVESHSIAQAQAALCELERLKGRAGAWDWSDCAVIARKWKCLEPLRSLCEFHGIPCQWAADSDVPVWQTRETQALLDWIEGRDNKHVNNAEICEWLNCQRSGPWIELLKEAAEEHADEAGDSKWPVESFREWLAEWAREARRRQRGLLLTTAHSAKGLEFDHVVVLDGGWKRGKSAEDLDAQRRLYYVAMTRARRTLTLMCMNRQGRHPLHATREFAEHLPSVLRREPPKLVAPPPEAARRHCVLTLGDVHLSYAGNQPPNHSLHRALAALAAGDPLQVRTDTQPWDMCDGRGMTVGRLATKFEPPQGQRLVSAKVHAVVVRRRDQSSPEYQEGHKCDRWETVIPELIFEPL
ncbi:MAG: RecQ family ATP-dependent DNA helicase [Acidimicrobiaceae bacterium]|nr:RecQ family ATP-dependent DNA helicase [Acidimicrobiaceae bacterium]